MSHTLAIKDPEPHYYISKCLWIVRRFSNYCHCGHSFSRYHRSIHCAMAFSPRRSKMPEEDLLMRSTQAKSIAAAPWIPFLKNNVRDRRFPQEHSKRRGAYFLKTPQVISSVYWTTFVGVLVQSSWRVLKCVKRSQLNRILLLTWLYWSP